MNSCFPDEGDTCHTPLTEEGREGGRTEATAARFITWWALEQLIGASAVTPPSLPFPNPAVTPPSPSQTLQSPLPPLPKPRSHPSLPPLPKPCSHPSLPPLPKPCSHPSLPFPNPALTPPSPSQTLQSPLPPLPKPCSHPSLPFPNPRVTPPVPVVLNTSMHHHLPHAVCPPRRRGSPGKRSHERCLSRYQGCPHSTTTTTTTTKPSSPFIFQFDLPINPPDLLLAFVTSGLVQSPAMHTKDQFT
ncbi:hypothetical protein Pcinc_036062 [Petrolisthes cinctipes]|uniref:Uncharacterized protein n=1 Tax=Petrolisthes cinctipes TaxID=88211 RepID=A0AAE1EP02_PETCI|nr:hypothetical protein Pcinc_036062 [Petrolisthes cinctipes]